MEKQNKKEVLIHDSNINSNLQANNVEIKMINKTATKFENNTSENKDVRKII